MPTQKRFVQSLAGSVILSGLLGSISTNMAADPLPWPYQKIESFDLGQKSKKVDEPSGLAWYPARNTLLVVGDKGDLYELKVESNDDFKEDVKFKTLGHKKLRLRQKTTELDFEGITIHPLTGFPWVVAENSGTIYPVDILDRNSDKWNIDESRGMSLGEIKFLGKEVFPHGGDGIEAIAFWPSPNQKKIVRDSNFIQVDHLWAANQSSTNSKEQKKKWGETPYLAIIPFKTIVNAGKITNYELDTANAKIINMNIEDMADMSFNQLDSNVKSHHMALVSDRLNRFYRLDSKGNILETTSIPGEDQEGICFTKQQSKQLVFMAQDSGGILVYVPQK